MEYFIYSFINFQKFGLWLKKISHCKMYQLHNLIIKFLEMLMTLKLIIFK